MMGDIKLSIAFTVILIFNLSFLEAYEEVTIISAENAEHLSQNKSLILNIFKEIKNKDNTWSGLIRNGEYIRVTFEKPLTIKNDITIYTRSIDEKPVSIEVYEKNKDNLIAKFENISNEVEKKIYLTKMSNNTYYSQDTFDLKILTEGKGAEFDLIIDPSWWNTTFQKRNRISFLEWQGTTAEELSYFPVLILLNDTNINYSLTSDSGEDIRFIDTDNTTSLPYEIELWNESGDSFIWVQVPILTNDTTDYIWIYYNNNTEVSDGQNITGVWDEYYRAIYHLPGNVSAGPTAPSPDSTSGDHDGSNVGVTAIVGKVGIGTSSTVGQRIEVAHNTDLDPSTGAWSISVFGKPPDSNQFGEFLGKRNGTSGEGWIFTITNSGFVGAGQVIGYSIYQDASNYHYSVTDADYVDNTWKHYVGVYNGSEIFIYIDGVSVAVTDPAAPAGTPDIQTGTDLRLHMSSPVATGYTGGLDEVRISNTTRSAAYINASYMTGFSPFTFSVLETEENPDTTSPSITIISPENLTNWNIISIELNVSADETINTWWYEYNGNGTNATFSPNITLEINDGDGDKNITVWANDSSGNENSTTVSFTIDTTSASTSSGGGSSGGSNGIPQNKSINNTKKEDLWKKICTSNWTCSDWGKCNKEAIENRKCKDLKKCKVSTNTPELARYCTTSCTENWTCEWSSCINGVSESSCRDLNSCGTTFDIPPRDIKCQEETNCIPSIKCEEWDQCETHYHLKDFEQDIPIEEIASTKLRICEDLNLCAKKIVESKECSDNSGVDTEISTVCGEEYIQLIDSLNGNALANIKEGEENGNKFLRIILSKDIYCDSCYNKIQDENETGIDCGENCIQCGKKYSVPTIEQRNFIEKSIYEGKKNNWWIGLLILIIILIITTYYFWKK